LAAAIRGDRGEPVALGACDAIRNGINVETANLLRELRQHKSVVSFGDLAEVRLGVVTGANDFFVLARDEIRATRMDQVTRRRVIAKTRQLTGLRCTRNDHDSLIRDGQRAQLVVPRRVFDSVHVKAWLEGGRRLQIHQRYKCQIRDPWYRVPLIPVPDAFVSCARGGPPRLVVNEARALCTNTLYAAYWRSPQDGLSLSVAFLCSLTAVFAEVTGRKYGGGVLKMEPSTLKVLPVPNVPVSRRDALRVDELLRRGDQTAALALADELVLKEGLGLDRQTIVQLRKTVAMLRGRRMPRPSRIAV
jgi:adenine-specific DNA-methyltransferase